MHIPADIPAETAEAIREMAIRAFSGDRRLGTVPGRFLHAQGGRSAIYERSEHDAGIYALQHVPADLEGSRRILCRDCWTR